MHARVDINDNECYMYQISLVTKNTKIREEKIERKRDECSSTNHFED